MSRTTTIGELCEVQSGGTPSRSVAEYWDGQIPWVKISDMLQGVITSTDECITQTGLDNSSAKVFPAGTLLLSIFATIGRTAVLAVPASTNQAIAGLRVKDRGQVDAGFLRRYLDFKAPTLADRARGVAQANINLSILRSTEVRLPPLPEQRRIAAILDQADALRAKRRQAMAKLDQLLQSVFLEMFGDPVTNPKGCRKATFGELLKVKSGDGLVAKDMRTGPYAVYGGNGISGYHDEFMFEAPQIVIGRVGVYCGAVHRTAPNSWVTDNALYVSELHQPMNERYLEHALRIANFNQYAGRAAQPLISGSRIYPVETLLPPLEDQEKFAERTSGIEQLGRRLFAAEAKVEELRTTLQAGLFQ